MKKIILKSRYVNQQEDIKDLFLNTKENLYLKKGSTGIGGTTALLEATDKSRIVISPTVGMIQGKEKQNSIKNPNCYYIYGGSEDKWEEFFNNPNNKVVNCTPEQIINLKLNKTSYFNILKEMTIFVDEIHQYIPDNSYRNSMSDFLNLIFKEWKANWILSTATDNTINNVLLDVPPSATYKSYEIIKNDAQKRCIEVIRSGNQLNKERILEIFHNSLTRGRKLLIATNRTDLHKKISKLTGFNVVNLVGQNIETKMRPVKDVEKIDEIIWDTVDIVMISSKYFAGFDIPLEVDVLIDTTPNITANLIGPNDIIQIIGRSRVSVDRIILHINLNRPDINEKNLYQPVLKSSNHKEFLKNLNNKISKRDDKNWLEYSEIIISDWAYYSILFPSILKISLNRYNYIETKYDNEKVEHLLTVQSWPFYNQMNKLLATDIEALTLDFYRITKYVRYKSDGIFSPDLALLFYSAILIKKRKLNIEVKSSDKPTRFYFKLNKYFKDDEKWCLLYSYLKSKLHKKDFKKIPKHSQFSKEQLEYLEIRSLPTMDIVNQSTGGFSCLVASLNILQQNNIFLNPGDKEYDKLQNRCYDVYNRNERNEIKTKEQLLNLIGWANLFVLNGGRESYNFELKRNREYNPLTMVPSPLRSMIGVKLVEIDIKQANPTFIDAILNSNIAPNIYDNISKKFNISRDEAKKIYNTYLNNDKNEPYKVYRFFSSIGYTQQQALELTDMVTTRKGLVYDKMTEKEREIIEGYANTFLSEVRWFRFHDAIIIRESDIKYYNLKLESSYKDVKFSFKYYNDGRPYFNDDNAGALIEDIFDFL